MKLFLAPLRFFISPVFIAAINLLLLFPMVLSVIDVIRGIARGINPDEAANILTTVGTMMIGWGVALEEREVIRKIASPHGWPDEARQALIDSQCHSFGVAQLVLGLFAEVGVGMISLPDRIINVAGLEYPLLTVSVVLIAIAAVIQARHILVLLFGLRRTGPMPGARRA